MTTSERIECLLEDVHLLQFGIAPEGSPPEAPKFCIIAKQTVPTSSQSVAEIEHKSFGNSVVECLEQLQTQVNGAANIKKKTASPILTPGGRRE